MRNKDVAENFINGRCATGSNYFSDGDKLFSYSTCIVQGYGRGYIVNTTHYSNSTSRHLNMFLRLNRLPIVEVDNIVRGEHDLVKAAGDTLYLSEL